MNLHFHAPQIIWLVGFAIILFFHFVNLGKGTRSLEYNPGGEIAWKLVGLGILIWGGFFG